MAEKLTKASFSKPMEVNSGIDLYSICKEEMRNEVPLNKRQYRLKLDEIQKYFASGFRYFMLLCHERRDYTLFNFVSKEPLTEARAAIKDCIDNRGRIISIDYIEETNAYEIWILMDGNDACCYHLFKYDNGVIEC